MGELLERSLAVKQLGKQVRNLGCLLVLLFSSSNVTAQVSDKPKEEWTVKEIEAFLTDSGWAQTIGGSAQVGGLPLSSAVEGNYFTIRLRSALPVRQALARLRELKSKYDKMSASDKAAIDAKNKPLLECPPCEDYYIITMSQGPGSNRGVPHAFETMSLNQAKLTVVLKNDKGETRELVNMVKPKVRGEDAIFFFARFSARGEPLFTTANRKVTLTFAPSLFEGNAMRSTTVDFDVARITINGQVVF